MAGFGRNFRSIGIAFFCVATLFASSFEAQARRSDGRFPSVTQFCGDRVCGWVEPGAFRTRAGRHAKTLRKIGRGHPAISRETGSTSRGRPREAQTYRAAFKTRILAHPPGCHWVAFCGCGAVHRLKEAYGVVVRNPRSLWLASNWLRFPRSEAAPGMVAVRPGHVFVIEKVVAPGLVLAYDANSGGHLTRLHLRPLAGFSVRNPRG